MSAYSAVCSVLTMSLMPNPDEDDGRDASGRRFLYDEGVAMKKTATLVV